MKKILSIFLVSTLWFNLLSISCCLFLSNNKFNFNGNNTSFIEQSYSAKKQLKKNKQRKTTNFVKRKRKAMLLDNLKLIDLNNKEFEKNLKIIDMKPKLEKEQKSYCVFKKRWCGYWKIYISRQDWKKALKIIDKIISKGIKIARLGKIITSDLIMLFVIKGQIANVTIVTIVAIILKLIEEGLTMTYSNIEKNKSATQVIVKFWMIIPLKISFR